MLIIKKANNISLKLVKGEIIEPKSADEKAYSTGDFTVDEKNKVVLITEEGIKKVEDLYEVDNLYSLDNAVLSHYIGPSFKSK